MGVFRALVVLLRGIFASRATLAVENLALRQQLAVFQRSVRRPKLPKPDRVPWVWLSRLWQGWRSALLIVQPQRVIRWHRQGFRLCWGWKSRQKGGRPKIDPELRELIRRMSQENITWGAPRILSELRLLGYAVSESTVARYMIRKPKPPSQTWRSFLKNHVGQIAATDFFTVPTVTFRVFHVFLVLRHQRRRVVHFNVTRNPTAQWAAQQIIEAFPYDKAPRFLLRDRDSIHGHHFWGRVQHMGIEEVLIAPRAPWQNPYVERVIGSIRRECLDHMIVLNEGHLHRILTLCFEYYHESRAHLSLDRNSPIPRNVEPLTEGRVVSIQQVGGLHHRCCRAA